MPPRRINVTELRSRLGLTQEDVVKLTGASIRSIRRWENDGVEPSPLAKRALQQLESQADEKAASSGVRRRVDEGGEDGTPPRRTIGVPSSS